MTRVSRQGNRRSKSTVGASGDGIAVVERVLEKAASQLRASFGTAYEAVDMAVRRAENRRRRAAQTSHSDIVKRAKRLARTAAVLKELKASRPKGFVSGMSARSDDQRATLRHELAEAMRQVEYTQIDTLEAPIRKDTIQRQAAELVRLLFGELDVNNIGTEAPPAPLLAAVVRLAKASTVKAPVTHLLDATPEPLRASVLADQAARRRVAEFESRTYFVALTKTVSGRSIQSTNHDVDDVDVSELLPYPTVRRQAIAAMRSAGMEIVFEGEFGITVACTAVQASELLGSPLRLDATTSHDPASRESSSLDADLLYVRPAQGLAVSGGRFAEFVDDFLFLPAVAPLATVQPTPPAFGYPHLSHPSMRSALGAAGTPPHLPGSWSGRGIKVAVIDTGVDSSHPVFGTVSGAITSVPTPVSPNGCIDSHGHGTGMAWCVLALAPEAELLAIDHQHRPDVALQAANKAGADIFCCPWGIHYLGPDAYLRTLIKRLISQGKVLLFAAGNGTEAWPGDLPEVISVGGVYSDDKGTLRPSSLTSWYTSTRYAGRLVPDVCGVSGDLPNGVYLPLPCPAGSKMDMKYAAKYDVGDGIAPDDGWVFASGSSAATAQVAGIAALLCQKARANGQPITQVVVKDWLVNGSIPPNIINTLLYSSPTLGTAPPHPGIVSAAKSLSLV